MMPLIPSTLLQALSVPSDIPGPPFLVTVPPIPESAMAQLNSTAAKAEPIIIRIDQTPSESDGSGKTSHEHEKREGKSFTA